MIKPVKDNVDAHFYPKNGASHAPDDARYLLSAQGQDGVRLPLARGCGLFNSIDNIISIPHSDDLTFGDGAGNDSPFSITGWFNIPSTKVQGIIGKGNRNLSQLHYQISFNTGGAQFSLYLFDGGISNYIYAYTNDLPPFNQWVYFATTYDASKLDTGISIEWIATDGTTSGNVSRATVGTYTGMPSDNVNQYIGSRAQAEDFFNGYLYDIRVHNKELTAEEIDTVRKFGYSGAEVGQWAIEEKAGNKAYDSSTQGNHGTINDDLTNFWYEGTDVPFNFANKIGFGGYEIGKNFVGTLNGELADNTPLQLQNFELEFKIRPTAFSSKWVATNGTYANNGWSIFIISDGQIRFHYVGNLITFYTFDLTGSETTNIRLIHRADSSTDIYVNNVKVVDGGLYALSYSPAENFVLAGLSNAAGSFQGDMTVFKLSATDASDNITETLIDIDFEASSGDTWVNKGTVGNLTVPVGNIPTTTVNAPVIPSATPTLDALGNPLTFSGAVRHRAQVVDVNVGNFPGGSYVETSLDTTSLTYVKINFETTVEYSINAPPVHVLMSGISGADEIDFFLGNFTGGYPDESIGIRRGGTVFGFRGGTIPIGTHVVEYIWNGSNDYDCYLDGVQLEKVLTNVFSSRISLNTHLIGKRASGNNFLGKIWDIQIEASTSHHWPFNDGSGTTVKDIVGGNDGTWVNFTDPNQWGKSDDAIDYRLLGSKTFIDTGSKINFNPFGALSADVPTAYEHEGVVPAAANMYLNQTFVGSPSFSTEADAAINNMEIKTSYERQFVAEFVEELKSQGNYNLIDDQMLLGLRHGSALKMMKGSATPVQSGGTFIEGVGFDVDGSGGNISTEIVLNGGINFQQNNALLGVFVVENRNATTFSYFTGAGVVGTRLLVGNPTTSTVFGLAGTAASVLSSPILNNSLYLMSRIDNANQSLYENGVIKSTVAEASVALVANKINISTYDTTSRNENQTIGSFVIGAAIGFDQLAYYNSLTKVQAKIEYGNLLKDFMIYNSQLQTADDVRRVYAFINEELGKMYGLENYESLALDKFIRSEKGVEG